MTLPLRLMSKNVVVTAKLSRELMTMSKGDRIDTVSSYANRFDSARGTVQKVIKLLEDEKAVELNKRGHLGTYITFIDYNKLWKFTYWGILTGAAPLPYTRKHEGIATAIYYQMEQRDIPFNFAYMQGAENRAIGLLNQRYDFIILSKESAMELISKYEELEIAIEFKPYSYLSGYALVYLEDRFSTIQDGMRLGIDNNSPDHVKLTKKLCKNINVEYVELQYTRMIPSLVNGKIDAAVYNQDTIYKPEIKGFVSHKKIDLTEFDGNEKTKAVILINKKTFGIRHLLKQVINIEEVEKIQNDVMAEIIIPTY